MNSVFPVQYAAEYTVRGKIGVLAAVSLKRPSPGGRILRESCRYSSAEGSISESELVVLRENS